MDESKKPKYESERKEAVKRHPGRSDGLRLAPTRFNIPPNSWRRTPDSWSGIVANMHQEMQFQPSRSYRSSKKIGWTGGNLKLSGCDVTVPNHAFTLERKITLETRYGKRNQNQEGEWMYFGPEIDLGPDGTAFLKPVRISVTSCYHAIAGSEVLVKVETGVFWDEHEQTRLGENGAFNFDVMHFSPYRFLLRMLGVEKRVAQMSFTRRNNDENEYEMIWCFCDNLREAKLEVQKEMTLQDFNLTKSTETFTMKCDDNVKVSLEIPGSEINPPVKIIPVNDLWFSDAMVKAEFIISNLRERSRITYKIEMIKSGQVEAHSSRVNTFTFLPDTGHMEPDIPGGATVLHRPVIDTLLLPQ